MKSRGVSPNAAVLTPETYSTIAIWSQQHPRRHYPVSPFSQALGCLRPSQISSTPSRVPSQPIWQQGTSKDAGEGPCAEDIEGVTHQTTVFEQTTP